MQKLFIVGNLTRDPDLRVTQSGLDVCSFTVAVNKRNRARTAGASPSRTAHDIAGSQPQEADFFRVTAWREMGKNCKQYLAKGRKVAVTGSVSVSTYQAQDGSTRAQLEVTADDVEFLTPKGEAPAQQPNVPQAVRPPEGGYVEVEDDDLPF